ncbi:ROK family protein [Desertivirga brevis]|uniref:ROK family protein n=1 Tax=Desertivirga brevis TaxID=2810310 RepID=UPI001A963BFA|nr:ROK family protein [Pedobacter sp. SYSU D00873]
MMDKPIVVGACIEDAFISAGLVNLESRELVQSSLRRKRVNPSGSKEEIISAWSGVLKEVMSMPGFSSGKVGIGIPGPVEYEEGIYHTLNKDRYGNLENQNVKQLLSEQTGIAKEDFKLINDAASFFHGEVFGGAVRGYKKSFGLTLGVGLGSARYDNGVLEDANLWNMPFADGVAEDYLSVNWLVNRFKALSGIEVLDLVEMKRYAPDPNVQQVFDEFASNLASFLLEVIKTEKPEVVLIGGHMESSNKYFFDKVKETVLLNGVKVPIMRAILGEKASVIGAASTWFSEGKLHV